MHSASVCAQPSGPSSLIRAPALTQKEISSLVKGRLLSGSRVAVILNRKRRLDRKRDKTPKLKGTGIILFISKLHQRHFLAADSQSCTTELYFSQFSFFEEDELTPLQLLRSSATSSQCSSTTTVAAAAAALILTQEDRTANTEARRMVATQGEKNKSSGICWHHTLIAAIFSPQPRQTSWHS